MLELQEKDNMQDTLATQPVSLLIQTVQCVKSGPHELQACPFTTPSWGGGRALSHSRRFKSSL